MQPSKYLINDLCGNDLINIYVINRYDDLEPISNYEFTELLEKVKSGKYYELGKYFYQPDHLSFGDYDNSCHIERANVKHILENFEELVSSGVILHKHYAYSSEVIYVDIFCENVELNECILSLQNYPAINDEECSIMESDMIFEAFDHWVHSDICKAIVKNHNWNISEQYEYELEIIDSDSLLHFIECENNGDLIFIESGGIVYFDIEKIANLFEICVDSVPEFMKLERTELD